MRFIIKNTTVAAFAAVLLQAALPAAARAQNSATASATADVQQPIVVTKTSDLAFGNVFPGLNKTIAVTDAGAAAFTVTGQGSANVNLTFSLPTSLTNGANSLPLGSWTARRNSTSSPSSGTDFTPSSGATSTTFSSGGAIYVYVGATAQPSVSLPAGVYTGTLSLTVVYF